MSEKKNKRDVMLDILYKKGVGYQTEEIVEEYASEDKGGELLKRKITNAGNEVPAEVEDEWNYLNC